MRNSQGIPMWAFVLVLAFLAFIFIFIGRAVDEKCKAGDETACFAQACAASFDD